MSDLAETPAADIHPVGGALTGTHADNLRHAIVRANFMNLIQSDPRVRDLFSEWSRVTNLGARAAAVARAHHEVLRAAGMKNQAATLVDHLNNPALRRPAVVPYVETFLAASEQFLRELQPAKRPPLEPRPTTFVRDTLHLSYAWLAYELIDCFFRQLQRQAFGFTEIREYTVVALGPPAPRLTFEFQTTGSDSVGEVRARLLSDVTALLQALAPAERRPRGRRPKRADHAYLANWACWFYRVRVQAPPSTVAALARDYVTDRARGDEHITFAGARRAVQYGIREADRVLSLGQYELRPREN
jgi:hypothetical protein